MDNNQTVAKKQHKYGVDPNETEKESAAKKDGDESIYSEQNCPAIKIENIF